MDEPFRIEQAGPRLELPRRAYRVVSAGALASDPDLAGLVEAALREGAVRFSLPGYDGERTPGALLRVGAPWLVLERGGERRGAATRGASRGGRHLVALACDDGPFSSEEWALAPELVAGGVAPGGAPGAWQGEGWRLGAHPLCLEGRRDWAWAWGGGSWGPVVLRLALPRREAELRAWLASLEPLPYLRRPGQADAAAPGADGGALLTARDGALELVRSHHEPSEALRGVDAGLLDALARGTLGPLAWDLTEEDYGSELATGETGASLAEYLDPSSDEGALRARWRRTFAEQAVAALDRETPDAASRALAEQLGLAGVRTAADLERALAAAPFASLPRSLTLDLALPFEKAHGSDWFFQAVRRAHPRLRWRLRYRARP